jgi:hypothetical protein
LTPRRSRCEKGDWETRTGEAAAMDGHSVVVRYVEIQFYDVASAKYSGVTDASA